MVGTMLHEDTMNISQTAVLTATIAKRDIVHSIAFTISCVMLFLSSFRTCPPLLDNIPELTLNLFVVQDVSHQNYFVVFVK